MRDDGRVGEHGEAGAPGGERLGVLDTSFRRALQRLDGAGRLRKVEQALERDLEVAGVMRALDGGEALLFEAVKGATMPVLGNFLACSENVEAAFGLRREEVRSAMLRALSSPVEPVVLERRPDDRRIYRDGIDLAALLPVLRHTPDDGGYFITAGVVVTVDPEIGVPNASYHRLQVVGPSTTAIKLDYGRHLLAAYEAACRAGRPLPVAVCLGTDLALMHAAAFMGSQVPREVSELDVAGGLRGAGLELVPCVSQPLAVPLETEIVLEGAIVPDSSVHEGPFAEFIGYLSEAGPAPVLEVTAVSVRADPVYHAINGAGRETVMLRKYVLEAAALQALRRAVPIVTDVDLTAGGLHRFHLVVQVAKASPQHDGWQRNAILAAFSALKDLDLVVVVDDDIDPHDPADVEYAIATRMEASRDLLVLPEARGHEYVRVSRGGQRTKLGIDATVPYGERARFARARFSEVALDPGAVRSARGSASLPWLTA
ncbi:MAG TPA: UbiD family decarboxylase [Acidimicrobiales bacterium]|nr:UbiD family decarboxylase [Acidimicrobiales bacterium]